MNSSTKNNLHTCELNEIEKTFYYHFTKRQDNYNTFLIKLLLIISGVIYGYGYLLKFKLDEIDKDMVFFMVIFTQILLVIYFKIIYDEGFAFRRDQLVVVRILKKYSLIANNQLENSDPNKVFTTYFNPLKRFNYVNGKLKAKKRFIVFLMPAFHNTLAAAIFIIHLLVYISFLFKVKEFNNQNLLYAAITTSTIITIWIVIRKNIWLKRIYALEYKASLKNDCESDKI